MRHIRDCLLYKSGEDVLPHVLYRGMSDPIILQGKVDFHVFGTVYLNGVKCTDTSMHINLAKPTQFEVTDESAILFHSAPLIAKKCEEPEEVPAVPDYQDAMTKQMHVLFNAWAKQQGLVVGESDSLPAEGADQFDDLIEDEDSEFGYLYDEGQVIPFVDDLSAEVSKKPTDEESSEPVTQQESRDALDDDGRELEESEPTGELHDSKI